MYILECYSFVFKHLIFPPTSVFCIDLPLEPGAFNLPLHMAGTAGLAGLAGTTDLLHSDSSGLVSQTLNDRVHIEMTSVLLFTIVY